MDLIIDKYKISYDWNFNKSISIIYLMAYDAEN